LREINKRDLVDEGEDCSKWDFVIATVFSSALEKLSVEDTAKISNN